MTGHPCCCVVTSSSSSSSSSVPSSSSSSNPSSSSSSSSISSSSSNPSSSSSSVPSSSIPSSSNPSSSTPSSSNPSSGNPSSSGSSSSFNDCQCCFECTVDALNYHTQKGASELYPDFNPLDYACYPTSDQFTGGCDGNETVPPTDPFDDCVAMYADMFSADSLVFLDGLSASEGETVFFGACYKNGVRIS